MLYQKGTGFGEAKKGGVFIFESEVRHMPVGDNPNSRANLAKSYGGTGKMDTEAARRANARSHAKKAAVKAARLAAEKTILADDPFTPELIAQIKRDLATAAAAGDKEAQKLVLKISGEDQTEGQKKRAEAELGKIKKETKKIEADTKRIEAETELIKLKIAAPTEEEDDGFFDAIEGRIPDVWDLPEGGDHE